MMKALFHGRSANTAPAEALTPTSHQKQRSSRGAKENVDPAYAVSPADIAALRTPSASGRPPLAPKSRSPLHPRPSPGASDVPLKKKKLNMEALPDPLLSSLESSEKVVGIFAWYGDLLPIFDGVVGIRRERLVQGVDRARAGAGGSGGAAGAYAAFFFRRGGRFRSRVVGIIPARFASTRFEGKPLVEILGKPMIQVTVYLYSPLFWSYRVFGGVESVFRMGGMQFCSHSVLLIFFSTLD